MVHTAIKRAFRWLIVLSPLLACMYALYWLEASQTWVPETPHRDKITIAAVALAMLCSFFIQSWFFKTDKKK